ncbi:MAG: amidohydrolase [Boseongicola sp. SB0673_bin_14]|nr:amidohydrolase [Boseongicola sp. SB0667_bin_21]MYI67574.1 amidohydrolase [Boseongicola sp. SB0673_bin_14]
MAGFARHLPALQTVVSRRLAPSAVAVASAREAVSNGQRNVLLGLEILMGDARAMSHGDRALIERRMRRVAPGAAAAHGVDVTVDFRTGRIETIKDAEAAANVVAAASSPCHDADADRPSTSLAEGSCPACRRRVRPLSADRQRGRRLQRMPDPLRRPRLQRRPAAPGGKSPGRAGAPAPGDHLEIGSFPK